MGWGEGAAKRKKQRNMYQMKVQNKTKQKEKELNKMETGNLLNAELKTLVLKIRNELRETVDELSENFRKV